VEGGCGLLWSAFDNIEVAQKGNRNWAASRDTQKQKSKSVLSTYI